MVCFAELEGVVLACKCKEPVQARRTMIVVVFVPAAFLCPSVARSLPPMSRSATCLVFDVLELSECRSPTQADQRNTSSVWDPVSTEGRGECYRLRGRWRSESPALTQHPFILLVVGSNERVSKRQGRERAQIVHEAMHVRCFVIRSVVVFVQSAEVISRRFATGAVPSLNGLPSVQN